jgi:Cys-rich four helix bundle protein (predicted Tat secretion target)
MSNRREFLATAGTVVAGASLLAAREAHAAPAATGAPAKDAYAEVVESTTNCIRAGEVCVAHCTTELAGGNTSMANCNKRVHEMLALTRAMLTLAASKSDLAGKLASVCAEACKTCAAACAEHKEHWGHGMHLACKDCYEACLACEKNCRKLAG